MQEPTQEITRELIYMRFEKTACSIVIDEIPNNVVEDLRVLKKAASKFGLDYDITYVSVTHEDLKRFLDRKQKDVEVEIEIYDWDNNLNKEKILEPSVGIKSLQIWAEDWYGLTIHSFSLVLIYFLFQRTNSLSHKTNIKRFTGSVCEIDEDSDEFFENLRTARKQETLFSYHNSLPTLIVTNDSNIYHCEEACKTFLLNNMMADLESVIPHKNYSVFYPDGNSDLAFKAIATSLYLTYVCPYSVYFKKLKSTGEIVHVRCTVNRANSESISIVDIPRGLTDDEILKDVEVKTKDLEDFSHKDFLEAYTKYPDFYQSSIESLQALNW